MNRGPVKNSRPDGRSFVEKAIDAHGSPLPDWLEELARFADANDLGVAGECISYSRSAVSTIISGKYPGDIARVEQMVRGALMALTVECPVLGEIGRDQCLTEQKEPFRATSRHRAQLFHQCKICPQRRTQ
ncbi:transcriptional regulator [Mesorhizobium sp.]|uniref:transcriptional regulator n=1 Tax=Mesorhizobium sp. TaxID=1871066 RepID=UPI000FE99C75|nr:transcriptional regulator [Mesorhizobium sp.]RWC58894.1 MAG: transcriptional regulator [Mesorhizobium sp.]RWC66506.1 MAG: transcriptional regulator [Mesorhizobium sp.]